MTIEFVVDSIDAVDESLRGAYIENEGKYAFDPDKYAELKAAGLKKKNYELIDAQKKLKGELSKFEKFKDVDPADLEEFFEYREAKQTGNGEAGKDGAPDEAARKYEKALKKWESKYNSEAQAWAAEREQIMGELRHYKLTVPLKEIALKAGVLPDDIDLALLETSKFFKLTDDNKIVVLDEDGDPTGDTPEKFFKEVYRERRPKFYQATGAAGSGATPGAKAGANGRKTMARATFEKLPPVDQMKFVRDGGTIHD